MERKEKIDMIIEFLEENHINIIYRTSVGSVIVDAEQSLNKVDHKYEYNELLEKGLTDSDIEFFKKFLEKNTLMMIKIDNISGVSFEDCEYNIDDLCETDLLRDDVDKKEAFKNAITKEG
jgi:hypothetical protein